MSSKQKMVDLRQQLERWKSHNEVYAKPADKMLYEFLSELLNLADVDEQPELQEEGEVVPEAQKTTKAKKNAKTLDDESGPGSNHPENPSGKP